MKKFDRLADLMTRDWKGVFEHTMDLKVGKIPCQVKVNLVEVVSGRRGSIVFSTKAGCLTRVYQITSQYMHLLSETYDSTAGSNLEQMFVEFANILTQQLRLWQHCDIHVKDDVARASLLHEVRTYMNQYSYMDMSGGFDPYAQVLLTEAVRHYNAKRKAKK